MARHQQRPPIPRAHRVGLREGRDDAERNYRQTRMLLGQHPDLAGIYNIGGGVESAISLVECIDLIASITGRKPDVQMRPGRHGDLHYFVCDSSKARQQLQWTPKVRPVAGVRQLIDWTRANFDLFTPAAAMKA